MRPKPEPARRDLAAALGLALLLLALRVVHARRLSPYAIEADEAQYWDWSRRLAASYYSKGPGIAWAIAASTAAFGDTLFAVKLVGAVAGAVTIVAAGVAGRVCGDGLRWPAAYAALAVAATPAFLGTAFFTTTDAPYAALWLAALAAVAWATRDGRTPRTRLGGWAAAGTLLGAAALFKYTALFLAPGVLLFLVLRPRARALLRRDAAGVALGAAATLAAFSPVLAWNAARGWPTVAHQLGRVGLPGGDEPVAWSWSPLDPLAFFGAQAALLGVAGVVLIPLACAWAWGRRRDAPAAWPGHLLLLCSAAPILLFYAVLAVLTRAQANWALAGYAGPVVLVGLAAAAEMPRHAAAVRRWRRLPRPRPREGILSRKPETWLQIGWHWLLAVGVVASVALAAGPALLRLPGVGGLGFARKAAGRVDARDAWVAAVETQREALRAAAPAAGDPPIVCSRYQEASLLAFSLPGQPRTRSAASALGARRSPYDFFDDTRLDDPRLEGRTLLLVGSTPARWSGALRFSGVEPRRERGPALAWGLAFAGVRSAGSEAPR